MLSRSLYKGEKCEMKNVIIVESVKGYAVKKVITKSEKPSVYITLTQHAFGSFGLIPRRSLIGEYLIQDQL